MLLLQYLNNVQGDWPLQAHEEVSYLVCKVTQKLILWGRYWLREHRLQLCAGLFILWFYCCFVVFFLQRVSLWPLVLSERSSRTFATPAYFLVWKKLS